MLNIIDHCYLTRIWNKLSKLQTVLIVPVLILITVHQVVSALNYILVDL